ncbi:MAG: hypothetical protein HY903_20105 [Deltaproteobacteria bacterium]|nr:hypothetical protein [Deltaproteobacteria bacterium]
MTRQPSTGRFTAALFLSMLILTTLVVGGMLKACGEEECLAWGENCSLDYKEQNYGTTDIQCCRGQCTDHGSGIVTCGS